MRPDLGHCVMLRDRDVRLIAPGIVAPAPAPQAELADVGLTAAETSPAAPRIAPE
jgi:hypothetical protein